MKARRGFTLLEMLVATTILGVAVAGLLAQLSTSLRSATRLVDYDRAAVLARMKMDEILLDPRLPIETTLEGTFDEKLAGGEPAGWQARLSPFEAPPDSAAGVAILQRIQLRVWWGAGTEDHRKSISVDGFRTAVLPAPEAAR
jgi:general secretion pathway protein I